MTFYIGKSEVNGLYWASCWHFKLKIVTVWANTIDDVFRALVATVNS